MKNIIYILLILISINTKAQNKNPEDYLPMAVENANWLVYATETDFLPPFEDYYFGYRINGDTIINGIDYKKVYFRSYNQRPSNEGPEILPLTSFTDYIFGAIRDDIPNKKVYGIQFCDFNFGNELTNCPCDNEFLMYDFTMEIGDIYYQCIMTAPTVDSVYDITTEFVYGQSRKVQYIQPIFETTIFEGIGGFSGLFNTVSNGFHECLEYPCILELVHYCVGTDEECLSDYVNLGIDDISLEVNFSIQPNPANQIITVKNEFNLPIKSIVVYNVLGKKLFKTTKSIIDVSLFNKGIYVLKIETETGLTTIKKIIKN